MFNNKSIFGNSNSNKNLIDSIKESDTIFVADVYVDEYIGGAEITTEVFYNSSKENKVCKVKCNELTIEMLEAGVLKHWVFFNYASLQRDLIPIVVANLEYSIVEYDYKFCKYRSQEKHYEIEGVKCDCHDQEIGKMISSFMHGAKNLFWMSRDQKEIYTNLFPFLSKNNNFVISSAFTRKTLEKLKRNRNSSKKRNGKAMIIGSNSWIKGVKDSISYCNKKDLNYDIIENVTHDVILQKMEEYSDFVFMPKGKDTCPRVLIEAKLSGMNIHTNNNCQHTN